MAIKRIVDTGFWTDDKVIEQFSPEDRYFMLYLLTNPHTTQLGIYSLIPRIASFELGYSTDTVNVLIERFENKYGIIKYSKSTKEVAIKNYLVYSIVKGGKPVEDLLYREIKQVKSKTLISFVFDRLYEKDNINATVQNVIAQYKTINDNENDNDNDVSLERYVDDSLALTVTEEKFNAFWEAYPRKSDKAKARKIFEKLMKEKGLDIEIVISKAGEYSSSVQGQDQKFVRLPTTWLNGRNWEDEQIKILNNSITGCRQDIYPLKETQQKCEEIISRNYTSEEIRNAFSSLESLDEF